MDRLVGREKEREGPGRGGGLITARGTWLLQTILTHGLATRIAPHPIGQAAKKKKQEQQQQQLQQELQQSQHEQHRQH